MRIFSGNKKRLDRSGFPSKRHRARAENGADLELTYLEPRRVLSVDMVIAAMDMSAMEGDSLTIQVATFTDTDLNNSPHSAVIDWGDGTITPGSVSDISAGQPIGTVTGSHQYTDDGLFNVQVTVIGADFSTQSDTFQIDVSNVDPEISMLFVDPMVDENGTVKISGLVSDVGTDDILTLVVDWGPGQQPDQLNFIQGSTIFILSNTYSDDALTSGPMDDYQINLTLTDDDQGMAMASVTTTVKNVPPQIEILSSTMMTDENGTVNIHGRITDASPDDTFTLVVDWGPGEQPDQYNLGPGTSEFMISHTYRDDNPSGTMADDYNILLTAIDDDQGMAMTSVTTTVKNVPPQIEILSSTMMTDENGTVNIHGRITDASPDDTFTLIVNWGPGEQPDQINLGPGTSEFMISHTYRDDNPSGTMADDYNILLTAIDDDQGVGMASVVTTVKNVPPQIEIISSTMMIDENGTVNIHGRITDASPDDTFTLIVNWGPGEQPDQINLGPGTSEFMISHTYLDDNPTATIEDIYKIDLFAIDDDLGVGAISVETKVKDVPPTITELTNTGVDTSRKTTISGKFTDPGTQDTFTLRVDWGDGQIEDFLFPANSGETDFMIEHQYLAVLDPNVDLEIRVAVIDDDTGSHLRSTFADVEPVVVPADDGDSDEESDDNANALRQAIDAALDTNPRLLSSLFVTADTTTPPIISSTEFTLGQAESVTAVEKGYVIRKVNPDGTESKSVKLREDILDHLPQLYQRLLNDRYRIYFIREDGEQRLVLDTIIRNGKPVDPTDIDSEGTLDRPPMNQNQTPKGEANPDTGVFQQEDWRESLDSQPEPSSGPSLVDSDREGLHLESFVWDSSDVSAEEVLLSAFDSTEIDPGPETDSEQLAGSETGGLAEDASVVALTGSAGILALRRRRRAREKEAQAEKTMKARAEKVLRRVPR